MADAKIEIKVGAFSFSGEGTEKWLSGELEKLLAKIPELVDVAAPENGGGKVQREAGAERRPKWATPLV